MQDRPLLSTTDNKLLFRQQRVRNTKSSIKKLEEWMKTETSHNFHGRVFTSEYHDKLLRLKFSKQLLKELERDLSTYRNSIYRKRSRKKICTRL